MKLILKRDWDIQISPPIIDESLKGHHGGRIKEVEMLTNELLRGKKGSILISGYRGVGKTSLVYKSLWDAKNNKNDFIYVLLNAAQLEIDPAKEEIEPRKIIENLIRRLFSTTMKDKRINLSLRGRINSLYRKAIATDYRKSETSAKQDEDFSETSKQAKIDFASDEKSLIFIISWTIATVCQFMPFLPWEGINKITPLLLAFPIPYSLNIYYSKFLASKNTKSEKDITEELYNFDNNLGNLEFDLEQLHREINAEGKKLVYVIDELDKLEAKSIDKLLDYFKNFFTLSDAIFIFIGGEEIYDLDSSRGMTNQKNIPYRNKNYTYFTSRYFIPRPLWEDLSGFLDSVVDDFNESDEKEVEILKRALCFESKNDFYDIKYCIKDRIKEFDNSERPIINIILSEEDIQKARYHKAVTILFEEKYRLLSPSKWKENELLYRSLFDNAYKIYSSYPGDLIEDPTGDDSESEMLRDFYNLLYRIEAFELERIEKRPTEKNKHASIHNKKSEQIDISIYRYFGRIPNDPPCLFSRPTEFEKKFINRYEELYRYVLSLVNALKMAKEDNEITEEEFLNSLKDFKREQEIISNGLFDTLINYLNDFNVLSNNANDYIKQRDETEKNIKILETQMTALWRILPDIISKMIMDAYPNDYSLKSLKENDNYFSILDLSKRSSLKNNRVLINKDQSKQLIFLTTGNQISELIKEIKTNSNTHRAILISERAKESNSKGEYMVIIESPQTLKCSLRDLLKDLKNFYFKKKKG